MGRSGFVFLSRKLIISLAAVFLWMAFVTGIFSIVTGSYAIGLLSVGLALALAIVLIQGSLLARLERQRLPILSIVLVLAILVLVSVSELINLLITPVRLSLPYAFDVAYSVGVLVLSGYAASQLVRAPRQRNPESAEKDHA